MKFNNHFLPILRAIKDPFLHDVLRLLTGDEYNEDTSYVTVYRKISLNTAKSILR